MSTADDSRDRERYKLAMAAAVESDPLVQAVLSRFPGASVVAVRRDDSRPPLAAPPPTVILAEIAGSEDGLDFKVNLTLHNDTVVDAPEPCAFMMDWSRDRVRGHCNRMGWRPRVIRRIVPKEDS